MQKLDKPLTKKIIIQKKVQVRVNTGKGRNYKTAFKQERM
jgi:hypothetical protein